MGNKDSQPVRPTHLQPSSDGSSQSSELTCPLGCGRPAAANVVGFCSQCYQSYMRDYFEPSLAYPLPSSSKQSPAAPSTSTSASARDSGGSSNRRPVIYDSTRDAARIGAPSSGSSLDTSRMQGVAGSARGTTGSRPTGYTTGGPQGTAAPASSGGRAGVTTTRPSHKVVSGSENTQASAASRATYGHRSGYASSQSVHGTPQTAQSMATPSYVYPDQSTVSKPLTMHSHHSTNPSHTAYYPSGAIAKASPGAGHPGTRRISQASGVTSNKLQYPEMRTVKPSTTPLYPVSTPGRTQGRVTSSSRYPAQAAVPKPLTTKTGAGVTPEYSHPGPVAAPTLPAAVTGNYQSPKSGGPDSVPMISHLSGRNVLGSGGVATDPLTLSSDLTAAYGYPGIVTKGPTPHYPDLSGDPLRPPIEPEYKGRGGVSSGPLVYPFGGSVGATPSSSAHKDTSVRARNPFDQSAVHSPPHSNSGAMSRRSDFGGTFGNPYGGSTDGASGSIGDSGVPTLATGGVGRTSSQNTPAKDLWEVYRPGGMDGVRSGGSEDGPKIPDLMSLNLGHPYARRGHPSSISLADDGVLGGARPKFQAPKMLDRPLMEKLVRCLTYLDRSYFCEMLNLTEDEMGALCPSSVKADTLLAVIVCWKRKTMRNGDGEGACLEKLANILELYAQTDAAAIIRGTPIVLSMTPAEAPSPTRDALPASRDVTHMDQVGGDAVASGGSAPTVKGSGGDLFGSDVDELMTPGTGVDYFQQADEGVIPVEDDPAEDGGSSNSSKKVEGIRDNLLCPIHLDLVERAKTLPCQHFMCEECLRKWVASRGDLRCPTCNTIHVLPYGGVSKLPDNFVINNLVAEIQKLDMEDGQGEELQTLSRGEQRATSVSSQRVPDVLHEYQERATSYSGQKVPAVTSGMQQGAAQTSLRSKMEGDVSFGMWQRDVPISTNPHRTRGVPHAGASILTKLGNKMAVVRGYPIKLTLTLCDEEGEPMRGMQRETVEGTIHTPQGEQLPITDIEFKRRDGDYWIHFLPEEVGVHQIEVFLDGELVQGCPMKVVVRPNTSMLHLLVPGFMDNPVGVAATDAYVYVAETSDGLYRWMHMLGTTIGCPGLPGDDGDVSPFGIATMNDRLLITDCINSCVYVYDTGVYKQKFGTRVLESPTGIAVSKSGTIYVADMSTSSIDVFRPNFSHEGSINVRGKRGQSSFAMLALSQAEDRLIVADEMGEAIKIIDVQRRKIVKSINCRIQQAPARPFGVAVDEDDNIYISVTYDPTRKKATDRATGGGRLVGCIIVYNSNGYFLGTIGENDLQNPRGVCVVDEPTPQLIVVDDRGITEGSCLKFFEV